MHLAGAWMTEKYFARRIIPAISNFWIKSNNMQRTIENCVMAYGRILLKLKNFKGIHATADKK